MSRAIKGLSILLAVLAIGYFSLHAYRSLQGQDLSALLDTATLAGLVLLTAIYAASIVTTAAAWCWQLRAMGQPHDFRRFLGVLATTQFGKYLPGNVGQHVGRVGLAMAAGVTLPAALLSAGYEILLAIVAGAHLASAALVLAPPEAVEALPVMRYRWEFLILVTIGALVGLALAPGLASWLARRRSTDGQAIAWTELALGWRTALASYAMYLGSLSLIGFGLWGFAHALAGSSVDVPGAFFFIGAFATSWIAGFVVPGAPAGLGVRELVLAAWLSEALPPSMVVVMIIALRIATTIGDAINFGWGSVLVVRDRRRAAGQAPA